MPDYQLSLAIGKEGQNARLAAKLTSWKIDIKSESQAIAQNLIPAESFAADGQYNEYYDSEYYDEEYGEYDENYDGYDGEVYEEGYEEDYGEEGYDQAYDEGYEEIYNEEGYDEYPEENYDEYGDPEGVYAPGDSYEPLPEDIPAGGKKKCSNIKIIPFLDGTKSSFNPDESLKLKK